MGRDCRRVPDPPRHPERRPAAAAPTDVIEGLLINTTPEETWQPQSSESARSERSSPSISSRVASEWFSLLVARPTRPPSRNSSGPGRRRLGRGCDRAGRHRRPCRLVRHHQGARRRARSAFAGKIVVDPSNPVAAGADGQSARTLPDGVSAGSVIAEALRPRPLRQGFRDAHRWRCRPSASYLPTSSPSPDNTAAERSRTWCSTRRRPRSRPPYS